MTFAGDPLFPHSAARGIVRLFPLPGPVLFPHGGLPLRIFEPRYVEMLEEALAGDRLIAMALLVEGWQTDYYGRPPIAPVVCIGRVSTFSRQEDGSYNILLTGISRARVLRELAPSRPFREAEVELLPDRESAHSAAERPALQKQLVDALQGLVARIGSVSQQIEQFTSGALSLGALADIAAFVLPFETEVKQTLLAEADPDLRARQVLTLVRQFLDERKSSGKSEKFPPEFSEN